MKTVACIIARTNSTRLPKKVLKEISGKKIIEYIIDKIKNVRGLDVIYLCTSVDDDDKILIEVAKKNGIKAYAGSRSSIIDRMLDVAKIEGATNVIRITGDNVFTDEVFLTKMIEEHNKDPSIDYTRTEFLPSGMTAEVIKVEALKECYQRMDPNKSEYLMLYMYDPKLYNCLVLIPEISFQKKFTTLTVDTPEDFERTEFIIKNISKKEGFFYDDILKLNDERTIPYFEVKTKGVEVKLPDDTKMSFIKFYKDVLGPKIDNSKKIYLKEGFYKEEKEKILTSS